MVRTIATWMAPVLCFSAQDLADELERQTGTAFDVHGQLWATSENTVANTTMLSEQTRIWEQELRRLRTLVLGKLEAFRATGHKSLDAEITVRPDPQSRPLWQAHLDHLVELCEVSQMKLADGDVTETEITVAEAPGPLCPRCWRRTGTASGHAQDANLCTRCASVVSSLDTPGSP
jgi:isoleucyl-tRNA synthetase